MSKSLITREELIRNISNPDVPLEQSLDYLRFQYDATHGVKVDADDEFLQVDSSAASPLTEANVAFDWVVKALRARRRDIFFNRLKSSANDPIVLLDGDSWAQHPFVDEIFDHLTTDYNVFCSSLAGRTMKELHDENLYIEMLQTVEDEDRFSQISAIVLSGGGNDLFGEKFSEIVTGFDAGSANDPAAHIDQQQYNTLMQEISGFYQGVIRKILVTYPGASFPIILHSYTYLTPWDKDGGLLPKDKWIGDPMRDKNITELTLQKAIVAEMVDQFHTQLQTVIDSFDDPRLVLVDNRTLIPGQKALWSDEIHPSSSGFKRVGDRLKAAIAGN